METLSGESRREGIWYRKNLALENTALIFIKTTLGPLVHLKLAVGATRGVVRRKDWVRAGKKKTFTEQSNGIQKIWKALSETHAQAFS